MQGSDDVLAPTRQSEIEQVIAALMRFRPTKIAVEAGFNDRRVATRYADHLAGTHELTRNETEQLGFRLAKRLGHETVHPVDAGGEFPYPRLVKYATATGRVVRGTSRSRATARWPASRTCAPQCLAVLRVESQHEDAVEGDLPFRVQLRQVHGTR